MKYVMPSKPEIQLLMERKLTLLNKLINIDGFEVEIKELQDDIEDYKRVLV